MSLSASSSGKHPHPRLHPRQTSARAKSGGGDEGAVKREVWHARLHIREQHILIAIKAVLVGNCFVNALLLMDSG